MDAAEASNSYRERSKAFRREGQQATIALAVRLGYSMQRLRGYSPHGDWVGEHTRRTCKGIAVMGADNRRAMNTSVQIWRGRNLPADIARQIGAYDDEDWIIVVPVAYQGSDQETWLSGRLARKSMKQRRVSLREGSCAIIASLDKSRAVRPEDEPAPGGDSVSDWIC